MSKSNSLLVNLFAGPGTGKSTTMAGVFSELKWRGINAEMAPEFAKEKVWEESLKILDDQIYIFGKQLHTIERVWGKVDVVVTDSPLMLSLIYGKNECNEFKHLVVEMQKKFNSYNVFLRRIKKYNPSGRLQDEAGARKIDDDIICMLNIYSIPYASVDAGRDGVNAICNEVMSILGVTEGKFK